MLTPVDEDPRRALIIGSAGGETQELIRLLEATGVEVTIAESFDDTPSDLTSFEAVVATGPAAAGLVDSLRGDAALARLRAQNAALTQFASRASHDLKNPLAVMAGTADTLRSAWDRLEGTDRVQLLDAMVNQATKATALVNDLIALARSDPGRRATPVVDDVRLLVEQAVGLLPASPSDESAIVGEWPALAVPRSDLWSILSNLVDNAHHYGREEDGALHLVVSCREADGAERGDIAGPAVRLTVEDSGPGVPEGAAGLLFQPAGRLEGSQTRNPSSTGMGLAIVRRCAEGVGGRTGVERSAHGGATFWVTLPRAD